MQELEPPLFKARQKQGGFLIVTTLIIATKLECRGHDVAVKLRTSRIRFNDNIIGTKSPQCDRPGFS